MRFQVGHDFPGLNGGRTVPDGPAGTLPPGQSNGNMKVSSYVCRSLGGSPCIEHLVQNVHILAVPICIFRVCLARAPRPGWLTALLPGTRRPMGARLAPAVPQHARAGGPRGGPGCRGVRDANLNPNIYKSPLLQKGVPDSLTMARKVLLGQWPRPAGTFGTSLNEKGRGKMRCKCDIHSPSPRPFRVRDTDPLMSVTFSIPLQWWGPSINYVCALTPTQLRDA